MRPRYMTATRCEMWRTRRRSCATNRIVSRSRACSSSSRFTTCACTETSSAETSSSATRQSGLDGERAGDADPLALAAGELVRITSRRVRGQADEGQQLGDARRDCGSFAQPVDPERLAQHGADGLAGVERAVGVLEDHLDAAAVPPQAGALERAHVLAVVADRARVGLQEPHEAAREGRLAAARLADDPQRLALPHRQVHAVQRVHDPARPARERLAQAAGERKPLGEAGDLEQRMPPSGRPRRSWWTQADARSGPTVDQAAAGRAGRPRSRASSAARRRRHRAGPSTAGARRRSTRSGVADPGVAGRQRTQAGPPCRRGAARRTGRATGAVSMIRPAYMTATRSQVCATTPRSCVTRTTLMPSSRAGAAAAAGSGPGW